MKKLTKDKLLEQYDSPSGMVVAGFRYDYVMVVRCCVIVIYANFLNQLLLWV